MYNPPSSPPSLVTAQRTDSIVLLKDLHGYNTLHDDNIDSPKPHLGSPTPNSPYTPVPIPKSRLNRVDSITLLHNMNNLYTEDQDAKSDSPTPRTDKLRKANEKVRRDERRSEVIRQRGQEKARTPAQSFRTRHIIPSPQLPLQF
jgi:hypothetical protein